jgi:hypothetical protein
VEKYNTDFSKLDKPYGMLSGKNLEDGLTLPVNWITRDKENKNDYAS